MRQTHQFASFGDGGPTGAVDCGGWWGCRMTDYCQSARTYRDQRFRLIATTDSERLRPPGDGENRQGFAPFHREQGTPGSRLPMRKIHDVLRLCAAGMSKRKIAASLG